MPSYECDRGKHRAEGLPLGLSWEIQGLLYPKIKLAIIYCPGSRQSKNPLFTVKDGFIVKQ